MDCSTPGFPVLHNLPEFAQTHVCWISDAIQLSHRLSSPSPAFNLSQHWGLFQWVSSLLQVAKVLKLQLQHQSFQWIFRVDVLVYKHICWCLPYVCPDIPIGFDLVCLGRLIWIVFKLTWGNCVNLSWFWKLLTETVQGTKLQVCVSNCLLDVFTWISHLRHHEPLFLNLLHHFTSHFRDHCCWQL